jgi:hypothetical protein
MLFVDTLSFYATIYYNFYNKYKGLIFMVKILKS